MRRVSWRPIILTLSERNLEHHNKVNKKLKRTELIKLHLSSLQTALLINNNDECLPDPVPLSDVDDLIVISLKKCECDQRSSNECVIL